MQRPIRIFLWLILAITTISLSAQRDTSGLSKNSLPSKYQTETIYLRFSTYVKNGQAYNPGVLGGKLKKEMMVSPDAVRIFEKYQKQRVWSFVCAGLELASEIVGFTTKKKSLHTGLLISAGVVSLVSVPLYIGSNKNLNNALWIRNGAVLK